MMMMDPAEPTYSMHEVGGRQLKRLVLQTQHTKLPSMLAVLPEIPHCPLTAGICLAAISVGFWHGRHAAGHWSNVEGKLLYCVDNKAVQMIWDFAKVLGPHRLHKSAM